MKWLPLDPLYILKGGYKGRRGRLVGACLLVFDRLYELTDKVYVWSKVVMKTGELAHMVERPLRMR